MRRETGAVRLLGALHVFCRLPSTLGPLVSIIFLGPTARRRGAGPSGGGRSPVEGVCVAVSESVGPAAVPERTAPEEVVALRALHTVTRRVHASLDLAQTLQAVAHGVLEATCFGLVVINLRLSTGEYEVVTVEGDDTARAQLLGLVEPEHRWRELLQRGEAWGRLRFIHHSEADVEVDPIYLWVPPFAPSPDVLAWHPLDALFAPLVAPSGVLLGALSVDLPAGGRRPTRAQCEVLEVFADHAAIAIEHARLTSLLQTSHDEKAHAAHHDPLTGLANRALLMESGATAASAGDALLGVLVLDLDGFKAVNDAAGHHAGDEVLRVLAARMRTGVREQDLLARTGGDEFVVLISLPPGAGAEVLYALAHRLRAACDEPVTTEGYRWQLGASVGVALTATPTRFEDVLAAADTSMYRDKRTRRDTPGVMVTEAIVAGVGRATLAAARIEILLAGLHALLVGSDRHTTVKRQPSVVATEVKVAARVHLQDPLGATVIGWVAAATTVLGEHHSFLHSQADTSSHLNPEPPITELETRDLPALQQLSQRLHTTAHTGSAIINRVRTRG